MLSVPHQLRDDMNIYLLVRTTLKMFGKTIWKICYTCFKKLYGKTYKK
jgi:hypothetical protein